MKLELTKRELYVCGSIVCTLALIVCGTFVCLLDRARGPLDVDNTVATAQDERDGWAGADAVALSQDFIDGCPKFELVDENGVPVVQDNRTATVKLWEFVTKSAGQYPRNIPQQIGDCTSWGGKHAIEATEAGEIEAGAKAKFREIYPPFLYGAGRVWVLKGKLRGDGCTGAAIAEAAQRFGVLPIDEPGIPTYSGSVAREWGKNGPPEQFRARAAEHRIKTVSRARSVDDVRDAICNLYGVTIASDAGFTKFKTTDGRIVGIRNARWMHQMCIDGYDGNPDLKGGPYFHVQNSWGPSAHPQPIDGSPAGGFWITEKDMEYIVDCEDTWIFSGFDGFKVQRIDFKVTRGPKEMTNHASVALAL